MKKTENAEKRNDANCRAHARSVHPARAAEGGERYDYVRKIEALGSDADVTSARGHLDASSDFSDLGFTHIG